jgi:hypothetical protein
LSLIILEFEKIKVLKPQSKSSEFGRIRLKPLSKNLQISLIISKSRPKILFKKKNCITLGFAMVQI